MADHPIQIAGFVIPSSAPVFVALVAVHVVAGIVCVIAGLTAALTRKGRGPHTRAGLFYYWTLTVVCLTMAALAVLRWPEDNLLFGLGCFSFFGAFLARRFVTGRSGWRVRAHIVAMGTSYTLLLIAFYVDNGRQLPIWRHLPPTMYWLLPALVGLGLIARSYLRHPLARAEHDATARTI